VHPEATREWRSLLRRQAGIISVQQAEALGVTRERVRAHVMAGRWQRVCRAVFATSTGPLTPAQIAHAAVLYAGPGSAASHWSALALLDPDSPALLPSRLPTAHVTVAHDRRVRGQPGLVVHRSRRWGAAAYYAHAVPPCTRPARTYADCLAASRSEDDALALLARAVQRHHVSPAALLDELHAAATFPRRRVLLDAARLAGEGAHSVLEMRFDRAARAHGLPATAKQVREVRNQVVRLDVLFDRYDVVVELDGRLGHFDAAGWWRDMACDNAQQIGGRLVLRFPGSVLLRDPCAVVATVAEALRRRGWQGSGGCSRCRLRESGER